MIVTDGRSWPPGWLGKRRHQLWDRFRDWLVREVQVVDGEDSYRFRCSNLWEYLRCAGMLSKEPETCTWIAENVRPGEVFYDVGANIGIYSIFAARRVVPGGAVVAFEPHCKTFATLLDNIVANGIQDIVTACNFALHGEEGFFPFNYQSMTAGTSDSQLISRRGSREIEMVPKATELKYATSLDSLVLTGQLPAPHHVKIDVDGNEMMILRGMAGLLDRQDRPRSIQVEMNRRDKEEICPFLESHGYKMVLKHYSRSGQKKIAEGGDPEAYAYNAIFYSSSENSAA